MANNLTVNGAPTFAAAKFSNGLTAVSHSNFLNGAFNLGISSTNNWTLEGQVKTNSASVRVWAYVGIDSNSAQNFWVGTASNGNFAFSIAGGSGFADGSIVDSGVNISDNAFHHVALSCSGGTNLKVFVDGVLAANLTGVMPTIPAGFTLGVLNPGNGAFNVFDWPGSIDEVAVWSTQKYTVGFTPPSSAYAGNESNLVALYHLQADGTDSQGSVSSSATITEQNLPSNHNGNITVHVVGIGTSFGAGTTWTPSGVAGWTFVSKTAVDGTHQTVVLAPPAAASPPAGATGTLTLTEGVTGSVAATTTVGTPTLSISPNSGANGTTPTLTLTGAKTLWASETAAGLFTVAGGTGASIGTPTITTNTAGTVVLATGSAGGTLTITDTSTGAQATFTVTSLHYDRVDTTSANGQNIMLLIPNANSPVPYNPAVPTPLVIYFHGAGEIQTALLDDSLKASSFIAMIDAGYILCGSNAHGENWGNQASLLDYVDLAAYATANYNVSHILFWGQSMGGYSSLLSLSENLIPNVAGWLGTYPACSLASLYGLGTYAGEINTAFGISGSGGATYANLTRGFDPALKWGIAFRGVRMRFYASPSDTIVPKAANSDALHAIVNSSCAESTVVVCSGNHGDPSHFQPSDYVAFFNRCLASVPPTSGIIGGGSGSPFVEG